MDGTLYTSRLGSAGSKDGGTPLGYRLEAVDGGGRRPDSRATGYAATVVASYREHLTTGQLPYLFQNRPEVFYSLRDLLEHESDSLVSTVNGLDADQRGTHGAPLDARVQDASNRIAVAPLECIKEPVNDLNVRPRHHVPSLRSAIEGVCLARAGTPPDDAPPTHCPMLGIVPARSTGQPGHG
jgi:hypothetical protein